LQLALGKDGKGLALQWQRKGVVMGVEFAHLCCALLCAAVVVWLPGTQKDT
jgi:hypothetical protein